MKEWILYLVLMAIVLCEAIEDGLWEQNLKTWSKRVEALSSLLYLSILAFLTRDIWVTHTFKDKLNYVFVVIVAYTMIRTYLFDLVMHITSGWSANHVGRTSPAYDLLMSKLKGWGVWVWRGAWLVLSIFWYYYAVLRF